MKMPVIVGIFISISRENFMLSWVEQAKSGSLLTELLISRNFVHFSSSTWYEWFAIEKTGKSESVGPSIPEYGLAPLIVCLENKALAVSSSLWKIIVNEWLMLSFYTPMIYYVCLYVSRAGSLVYMRTANYSMLSVIYTVMARTSLEPLEFVPDMGSSSHWKWIKAPDQEANGDKLWISFRPSKQKWYVECTH